MQEIDRRRGVPQSFLRNVTETVVEKERKQRGLKQPQIYSPEGLEAEAGRDSHNKHDERGDTKGRNKVPDRWSTWPQDQRALNCT